MCHTYRLQNIRRTYVGMPVQLPQRTWLESNDCRRNGFGNWEGGGVDDSKGTASTRDLLERMVLSEVDVRSISRQWATVTTRVSHR